ncbi:MAG: hypothetical protein SH847_27425 [Roseiflexaceae bacterium]|nr:hypothetical protein [Roseiflexaceae bacterium]
MSYGFATHPTQRPRRLAVLPLLMIVWLVCSSILPSARAAANTAILTISEPPPPQPIAKDQLNATTTSLSEMVFIPEPSSNPNDDTIRFRAEGPLGSIGFSNQSITLALPINLPADPTPVVSGDSAAIPAVSRDAAATATDSAGSVCRLSAAL